MKKISSKTVQKAKDFCTSKKVIEALQIVNTVHKYHLTKSYN